MPSRAQLTAKPLATWLVTSRALKLGTTKISIDMIGMTSESSVLARITPAVGASSLIWLSWVNRRISDSNGPPPMTAWRVKSTRNAKASCPATKKKMVVNSATGQLRNVPAKTPMAVSTMACSQMPKSPFM